MCKLQEKYRPNGFLLFKRVPACELASAQKLLLITNSIQDAHRFGIITFTFGKLFES
jgi:hypothetical protein